MSDYLQDSIFNYQPQDEKKQDIKDNSFIFSYSRMSMYNECPLKYKFKYIDKIPEKPKKFLFIGRVVHSALEKFFSKVPPPSLEELNDFIIKEWNSTPYQQKGYASQEYDEIDLKKILNIIKNFHYKHSDNKQLPFLLEYSTYVTIDGYKLTIIADKIEYLGNGRIRIVDYKTGKEGDRTPQQLYFYQKVCEADPLLIKKIYEKYSETIDSVEVESMIYYYVENLKEVKYPRAKQNEIERFWESAVSVIENILSQKFNPTPSEKSCKWCDYKDICEIHSPKNKTNKLIQLCEEYINKNNQIEELKRQIQEIELKIIDEMKRENKTSLIIGTASLMIEKKPSIEDILRNREEIKRILKEKGLYEKASKITTSSVIEILQDLQTPKDVIEELKKLISYEEKISISDNKQ